MWCVADSSSSPSRANSQPAHSAFIRSSYPSVKSANPDLPILIREARGTPARGFVRFGQSLLFFFFLDPPLPPQTLFPVCTGLSIAYRVLRMDRAGLNGHRGGESRGANWRLGPCHCPRTLAGGRTPNDYETRATQLYEQTPHARANVLTTPLNTLLQSVASRSRSASRASRRPRRWSARSQACCRHPMTVIPQRDRF